MKILVTGDRGYIGAVVVPRLLTQGHEVVGLDAGWYDGCDFGPTGLASWGTDYESRTGDVRDVTVEDLRGFDAVVHLAAISNDPVGHLNPEATYSVNAYGAEHVAQMAKAAGVGRFVFASSCSLYGAAGDEPVDETGATNPVTPYGESKILAEGLLAKLADGSFSPTYMRNATAYGSSPRLRADIVVNNLSGVAHTQGEVRLQSDGTPWRPLVHIADISLAMECVLAAPREAIHDQAFNVGRDEDVVQIRTIAERVAATFGCPVTFAPGASADTRNYQVSFAKIHRVLPDFAPAWTVQQGIDELAGHMAERGLSTDQFEHGFVRLEQINRLKRAGLLDDMLGLRR